MLQNPVQCHLWNAKALRDRDLDCFQTVEELIDESHHIRALVRCTKCGQLYLRDLVEEVDWEGGEDPQFRSYVPVASREQAMEVHARHGESLQGCVPRIQSDWPKGVAAPRVYWVRGA